MTNVKEGTLICNGVQIRYCESGQGDPVVLFPANEKQPFDELAAELAVDHRVIVLNASEPSAEQSTMLAAGMRQALEQLEIASCCVIGVSQGTVAALDLALDESSQVQKLVLLSPPIAAIQAPHLSVRLKDIKPPTLVLVGTRDRSGARETGRLCREQIPICHLSLVYDAGQTLIADRREACLAPIREFITQGEGFIVSHESQVIRP
jgi:pimeloyl-ACP methyl ester carboxylesterase